MKSTEDSIIEYIDQKQEDFISFVQKIIKIPSITGKEAEIGKAIYEKMIKIGLDEVEIVEEEEGRPNVVGKLKGSKKGKVLLFNGHMDVVPYGPLEEWDFDPCSGNIDRGRLYGRGTVDMKSGTCSSILAVEVIKELNIPIKGEVILTAVCDEEVGGVKGIIHLINKGYINADMGINCEATNLKTIDIVHKGSYRCEVITYGKAIHGSRPWLGINAIEKAVEVLNRVKDLEKKLRLRKHPLLKYPTIHVGTIQGGTVVNMIPSQCKMTFDRRLIPGESFELAEKEIQDILDQLSKEDPDFRAELRNIQTKRPPLDVDPNSLVVKAIQKAHKKVIGENLPIGGKDAGTDASLITDATGMPMPVYGPGDYLKYSLAPNESIAIKDIIDAIKIYSLAIYYLLY